MIEDLLRQLTTSREMRQYRDTGQIHFTCTFEGVALIGGAKRTGEEVRLELRRMAGPTAAK